MRMRSASSPPEVFTAGCAVPQTARADGLQEKNRERKDDESQHRRGDQVGPGRVVQWYAFVLHGSGHDTPTGHVRQVTPLREPAADGTVVIEYDNGVVATVCGPHCSGRLFDTEAKAWAFCAARLSEEAGRLEAASRECLNRAAASAAKAAAEGTSPPSLVRYDSPEQIFNDS